MRTRSMCNTADSALTSYTRTMIRLGRFLDSLFRMMHRKIVRIRTSAVIRYHSLANGTVQVISTGYTRMLSRFPSTTRFAYLSRGYTIS